LMICSKYVAVTYFKVGMIIIDGAERMSDSNRHCSVI
jgi:hypothetical protein